MTIELGEVRQGDFVFIDCLREKGWPAGESLGLVELYGGRENYCPTCWFPYGEQQGRLRLKAEGLKPVPAAWSPHWSTGMICIDAELAEAASTRFPKLELREIAMPKSYVRAFQILVPVTKEDWWEHDALSAAVAAAHNGKTGKLCPDCDRYRWFSTTRGLPPLQFHPERYDTPIIASPELFGDGGDTVRASMLHRDFADLIVTASPKDFRLSRQ